MYGKTYPDDGQGNYPKRVEFYSKNKFEELVHLFGFIVSIYHDARSPERQIIYNTLRWDKAVGVCVWLCNKLNLCCR